MSTRRRRDRLTSCYCYLRCTRGGRLSVPCIARTRDAHLEADRRELAETLAHGLKPPAALPHAIHVNQVAVTAEKFLPSNSSDGDEADPSTSSSDGHDVRMARSPSLPHLNDHEAEHAFEAGMITEEVVAWVASQSSQELPGQDLPDHWDPAGDFTAEINDPESDRRSSASSFSRTSSSSEEEHSQRDEAPFYVDMDLGSGEDSSSQGSDRRGGPSPTSSDEDDARDEQLPHQVVDGGTRCQHGQDLFNAMARGHTPGPKPRNPPAAGDSAFAVIENLTESERATLFHYRTCVRTEATERQYHSFARGHERASREGGRHGVTIYGKRRGFGIMKRITKLKEDRWDMCPHSCMAFVGPHKDLHHCCQMRKGRLCGAARFDSQGNPVRQFVTLPILPRIRARYAAGHAPSYLYQRGQNAAQTWATPEHVFQDFSDGAIYRNLVENDMLTEARQDAFILGTDGAQFVNRRDSHGWIVILTNLNTPWQARSRREDTFVSTIVPGPNNPIDLDSFLWPVLAELARAARGYWIWDGLAREWFLWRAWLVSSAADQQASSRLSHMTGPTGFSGCKTCHMKADYAREGQTVGYFPLETLGGDPRRAQERPIAYDPYDLPHRTDDSYAEDLQLDSRRETGIGKRSTLSGMPAFTIPAFFPPDIFHLFGINLPSQVWSALCESRSGDPFTLSVQQRETFAELLKGAESDLPTSFCSAAPRDPSTCAGPTYKMYEWTCILYYYLPPFLLSIGAPEEVISMLEHLIAGVRIASSAFGCTSVQLWQLQDHFVAFVEEWERLYVREDPDCLHRATISVHHLLHVWYFIHAHGSVTITSQARCEREIGTAKRGLRSRKSEFVGLMNNVIQREHLRILDSIVVDEDVSVPREHDPNDTKFEVRLAPHHRSLSAQQVDDMEQSFRSHQEIGNLPTPFPPRRIFRGRCRHLSFSFRGSDIEGPKARKSSRFVVNADGSEMYCEALRFVYFLEDGERHTDDDPVDVRRAFALCRYLTNVEAAGGLKRGKWSDELGTISVRSILRPIGTFEVGEHIYVLEKLSWMTSEE